MRIPGLRLISAMAVPAWQTRARGGTRSGGTTLALVTGVHAFISYAREDKPRVDALQQRLEEAGIPVWRDTASLWPGDDWVAMVRDAITRDALVFIACFSKKSVAKDKGYQYQELTLAIEQFRRLRPGVPWLIPVRFNDCEIPEYDLGGGRTLSSLHITDVFGAGRGDAMTRLVQLVLRILPQDAQGSPVSKPSGREPPPKPARESAHPPGPASSRPARRDSDSNRNIRRHSGVARNRKAIDPGETAPIERGVDSHASQGELSAPRPDCFGGQREPAAPPPRANLVLRPLRPNSMS